MASVADEKTVETLRVLYGYDAVVNHSVTMKTLQVTRLLILLNTVQLVYGLLSFVDLSHVEQLPYSYPLQNTLQDDRRDIDFDVSYLLDSCWRLILVLYSGIDDCGELNAVCQLRVEW